MDESKIVSEELVMTGSCEKMEKPLQMSVVLGAMVIRATGDKMRVLLFTK